MEAAQRKIIGLKELTNFELKWGELTWLEMPVFCEDVVEEEQVLVQIPF